ncbi:FecR family protein [Noviherbaspirillum sp. ST9]|uniref:FecR family protein n=1 Tax=Noviherbaspirillum sp. ST9 TaxID=3401606 RepID=UPI003B58792E
MNQPRRCTAIKPLLFMSALVLSAQAWAAQVVGTVANLSGPLLAKKADGTSKVLAVKSSVEQGDTLISEKDTYARIKFIDNSEITLRPNSQLKIDNFSFEEDKPEKDSAAFNLVKGGLRAVTGTLGKRNKEKFGMNTPTATIGIRGTIFIAEYIAPNEEAVAAYGMASMAAMSVSGYADVRSDMPSAVPLQVLPIRLAQVPGQPPAPGSGGLAPGLYVQVLDGMIHLTNQGGTQNFSAGQFGYTASFQQPPVILPNNPGIKFAPPPAFNTSSGPQGGTGNASGSNAVDCEVR